MFKTLKILFKILFVSDIIFFYFVDYFYVKKMVYICILNYSGILL